MLNVEPIPQINSFLPTTSDLSKHQLAEFTTKHHDSKEFTVFTEPIDKPDTDFRDYRYLTLGNQLDILLISDKHTDKSSAALDVNVGHLSDPDEAMGLAHFCEHLRKYINILLTLIFFYFFSFSFFFLWCKWYSTNIYI